MKTKTEKQSSVPTDDMLTILSRQVAAQLHEATEERTRDVVQLTEAGERGLTILVTYEAIELRLATIDWGTSAPRDTSRFWKRVSWIRLETDGLEATLSAARKAREREFKPCRKCGESTPRERRIDLRICHSCAEQSGILF